MSDENKSVVEMDGTQSTSVTGKETGPKTSSAQGGLNNQGTIVNVNLASDNTSDVSPKSKTVLILLTLLLGYLGIHRFYVGKIGTGLLWMFTIGLLGIGWLIDLIIAITGGFKDCNGKMISK